MKVYFTPAIIFAAVFAAMPAQAREAGDLYVSASLGALFPQNINVRSPEDATDDFITRLRAIQIKADPVGLHFELGFGGYGLSYLKWEAAFGYRRYELKGQGEVNGYSFLGNLYFDLLAASDLLGEGSPHEAYIGAGAGFGVWQLHDFYDLDPPTNHNVAFMLNTMAGYNFHFSDNLAFGISYRFGYSEPEFYDDDINFKQFHHSVLATTIWLF